MAHHEVVRIFREHDVDGNGLITTRQLCELMYGLDAENWTEEKVNLLLIATGRNQGSNINFEEFAVRCCSQVAEEDAGDRAKLDPDYAKVFELGTAGEDLSETSVYHCTTVEAADSIMKTGFRFPVKGKTENRGWKLGYAVYFGVNPDYCMHEALNTLREEGPEPDPATLAMVKVAVKKGKFRALGGPYHSLRNECQWSQGKWDELTEQLDSAIVGAYGYRTLTINEGTDQAEVVVYDNSAIGHMEILPAWMFLNKEPIAGA